MDRSTNVYRVSVQVYEGPLDLLLSLIEHAELDITKLALAQVTDQFLNYLNNMQNSQAEEVSLFLVIASKLLQIKSEALLPRAPLHEPNEEDLGEALAQQLITYKKFKEIAGLLSIREGLGLKTYLRISKIPAVDGNFTLDGLTIDDLMEAAKQVLGSLESKETLNSVVSPPKITIREKIHLIANFLQNFGQTTFRQILESSSSRIEVVVTFLAILELIKQRAIQVKQDVLFGEINIQSVNSWHENDEFELEFGE